MYSFLIIKKIKILIMKNLIEAIYYINMDKSVERNNWMKKILQDEVFDTMKKHRITGVDGARNDILPFLASNLKNMHNKNPKIYACLLSHLFALLEFSKSNYDIALIVEDDLSLDYKKYWQEDLNTCVKNAPSDWEILQVSYLCKIPKKLYAPWNNYFCAAAYIVNKKGVLSFLKQQYINNQFILKQTKYHEADRYLFKSMKTYVYQYPFFTFRGKDSTLNLKGNSLKPSYIKTMHLPCKQKVEAMLKKRKITIKKIKRQNKTKRLP
jgi:GR25 family glycosyltransferase involved in LPS biosynthesis